MTESPTTGGDSPPGRDVGVGTVLGGKYEVVSLLGAGGMGSVWLARAIELDIEVAIKVVREEIVGPNVGERLLQEARAAARLGHPAIVRVLDFGRTELNDPYLVMERLIGEDLGSLVSRQPQSSPAFSVRMLLPIAHALATVHEKGIVHRDLKPENIFLTEGTEQGLTQPKLIDFGIAKLTAAGTERITGEGAIMGSPGYLSPQQASGVDVDARSDIWSFSVVLYELVAGKLPFDGPNQLALLRAIIELAPSRPAECDDALWAILERGLQKDVEGRWPSMRHMGVALAHWLLEQQVAEDITGSSLESIWTRRRQSDVDDSMPPVPLHTGSRPPYATPDPPSAPPVSTADEPESVAPRARGGPSYVASAAAVVAIGAAGLGLWLTLESSSGQTNDERPAQALRVDPTSSVQSTPVKPSALVLPTPDPTAALASSEALAGSKPPQRPVVPVVAKSAAPTATVAATATQTTTQTATASSVSPLKNPTF